MTVTREPDYKELLQHLWSERATTGRIAEINDERVFREQREDGSIDFGNQELSGIK